MVRSNNNRVSHGSTYCDGCNNLDNYDCFGKDIDIQVVRNNNSFSDYDNDNNIYGKPINSYSDNGNENNNDTFHDAIQVEDVIDDTYDDDDNFNRKPINNAIDDTNDDDDNNNQKSINNGFLQPVGKQKGPTGKDLQE